MRKYLFEEAAEVVFEHFTHERKGLYSCCTIRDLVNREEKKYRMYSPERLVYSSLFRSCTDSLYPFATGHDTATTMNHRVFLLLMAATFKGWYE